MREEVVAEVLDLEQARLTRCDSLSFAVVFGDLAAWPWPNHCESQSSRGEAHVVMLEHLFPIYRERAILDYAWQVPVTWFLISEWMFDSGQDTQSAYELLAELHQKQR